MDRFFLIYWQVDHRQQHKHVTAINAKTFSFFRSLNLLIDGFFFHTRPNTYLA